ncbi:MAG: gamma-glutamyl-gamma-aminobutyrate hydrolase family protein [Rhabdochlamydiaceae bacterium]|nr:gamma-glutamyl-gamma-aminobutyrate hydrolase family protein [Candidatus Amphrikana amoebophyrae]
MVLNTCLNSKNIDMSVKADPVFTYTDYIGHDTLKRVAKVALPFICFYTPAAMVITLGMGTVQIVSICKAAYETGTGDKLALSQNMVRVAVVATSVAMSVIMPGYVSMITHSFSIADGVAQIAINLWGNKGKEALESTASVFGNSVQLATEVYGGPFLMVASYAMQAIRYFYAGFNDAKEGHYIEMVANIILGSISSYQIKPHLQKIYDNHFSDKMSQDEWDAFVKLVDERAEHHSSIEQRKEKEVDFRSESAMSQKKYNSHEYLTKEKLEGTYNQPDEYIGYYFKWNKKIDLEKYLDEKGLKKSIVGLDLTASERLFSNMEIRNITFDSCKLAGKIGWSRFENVTIQHCDFSKAIMVENEFDRCTIIASRFAQTSLSNCTFTSTVFRGCGFDGAYFVNCQFKAVQIVGSSLKGATFLFSRFEEVALKACETAELFLSHGTEGIQLIYTKIAKITKPIIALGCELGHRGEYGCYIEKALKKLGARVILYPYAMTDMVDQSKVHTEVMSALNTDEVYGAKSRAKWVMDSAKEGSELSKVVEFTRALTQVVDGVIIPGGGDVQKCFYDIGVAEPGYINMRDIVEFSLIFEAQRQKKYLMGVCRGSQIINVALGGTLKQTDKGDGYQVLEVVPKQVTDRMRAVFGASVEKGFIGFSCHSQAVGKVSPDLTVVLKYKDCVKATISKEGNIFGFQFHPEDAIGMTDDGIQTLVTESVLASRMSVDRIIRTGNRLTGNSARVFWTQLSQVVRVSKFNVRDNLDIYRRFIKGAKKNRLFRVKTA